MNYNKNNYSNKIIDGLDLNNKDYLVKTKYISGKKYYSAVKDFDDNIDIKKPNLCSSQSVAEKIKLDVREQAVAKKEKSLAQREAALKAKEEEVQALLNSLKQKAEEAEAIEEAADSIMEEESPDNSEPASPPQSP